MGHSKKSRKLSVVAIIVVVLTLIITAVTYHNIHYAFKKKIINLTTVITPKQATKLYNPADNTVDGSPNGKMTMVVVFGYKCPMCRKALPAEGEFIKNNPNLRIIYKEFLLFGKKSALPAYAALAANRQGKYMAMHNAMLDATKPLTMSELLRLARKCDLNVQKFKTDIQNPKIHQQIKDNTKLLYSLNIKGAPAYIFTKTAVAKDPQLANKKKQLLYIGHLPEYALQTILDMARK